MLQASGREEGATFKYIIRNTRLSFLRLTTDLYKNGVARFWSTRRIKEESSKQPRENGFANGHKSSGRSRHRSHSRDRDVGREKDRRRSRSKDRKRSRSRDRKRSHSRERKRSRSRERKRSRSKERKRSRSKDRRRSHSKDRKRSHSRDRKRSRSKEKKRSRSKERKRSRSRDKKRSRSKERRRSRSKDRLRSRSKDHALLKPVEIAVVSPVRDFGRGIPTRSPSRERRRDLPGEELSPEERDARTVFCMQLSQRVRASDLEEFFSSVGKVKDVRLITCNKTRRFKGISYVEFKETESVPLAMGLNGQKLLGIPIIVQPTQAEKNRASTSAVPMIQKGATGPMRLYVGSLHFNITEDMLRGIFEPFGKIDNIQLIMDPETGRSKGYGFITFHDAEDAKKALEQLNGFELAGRPMKVGHVTERSDTSAGPSLLDSDELDRTGIDLGATGRLQLMFKLAEGTGMQIPQAAASALNLNSVAGIPQPQAAAAPPIATQCFMLSNMFDPSQETNPTWDQEIRDDVIEECNKHGGVMHVFVDKASPQGNVYCKCPSIATAVAAVNSLHGRWFAGRVITAAYVPLINYHSLFPDAMTATQLLLPQMRRM